MHFRALGLAEVSASQVLEPLAVSKSRAYQLKARLESMLATLVAPTGRPPKPSPRSSPPPLAAEVLRYLVEHPGAYRRHAQRNVYSDDFRVFILELRQQHREVPLDVFAEATTLPLGTLKDWCHHESVEPDRAEAKPEPEAPKLTPTQPQLQTLLAEWERWDGGFVDFCDHVHLHCRLPFKRHLIGRILHACGVRIPERRAGRSPDEDALRDAFTTYFPHAQWVGDGTLVPIEIDDELFAFNLELDVDAYSGAFVGAHVSEVEDSDAVIQTFRDAVAATGVRPLALLLDNKPSNHTPEVADELAETLLVPATPFRAQNKAHVEGAFGLLKPSLDGLALDATGCRRDLARSFLSALVIAVARAINRRPRRDRRGRSRVQLLGDTPSAEEIAQAKAELQALLDKQRKARQTRAARQDPVVRELVHAALDRLGLLDPHGHFLTAIARYPADPIIDGIAIFEAKQRVATLPDGADVRYLLGIIRNVTNEREQWALAEVLWTARVEARDAIAAHLQRQRDLVDASALQHARRIDLYIQRALDTDVRLDRHFWLDAAATVITTASPNEQRQLYHVATRRITSTYAIPPRDRHTAIRFLAAKVIPLS